MRLDNLNLKPWFCFSIPNVILLQKWSVRTSLLYMLVSWNVIAYVGYQYYNRKVLGLDVNLEESTAERMTRVNKIHNATVYRFNNIEYLGKKNLEPPSTQSDTCQCSDTEDLSC